MAQDTFNNASEPSETFTLQDFINLKLMDEQTYYNLSIVEKINGVLFTDHSLIDDYLDELNQICVSVALTDDEVKKYRYSPDLLAYDVYGSVQLDFIILKANDMIDPKEFNIKTIRLPYKSALGSFVSEIISGNNGYIEQNRIDNKLLN